MPKHTLYRILSFVLIPIAAMLAALAMMVLMTALANPPLLLPVFIIACVVIYVFSSFSFFTKGVLMARPRKPSLKDFIKVNAIVTIIFALFSLFQAAIALGNDKMLADIVDQALSVQANAANTSKATMMQALKGILYFLAVFSILLLIHIVLTFRMLKEYKHVFDVSSTDNPE